MSTTGIVITVVGAIILVALFVMAARALPRARERKAYEREVTARREEAIRAHNEAAALREARADELELQARQEREAAEIHQTRAEMHDKGLADHELGIDRDREGVAEGDADRSLASERDVAIGEGRFTRDGAREPADTDRATRR